MKKLVINFGSLKGEARKTISAHVQMILFNMGCSWEGYRLPMYMRERAILVGVLDNKFYLGACNIEDNGLFRAWLNEINAKNLDHIGYTILDAATEIEKIILYAEELLNQPTTKVIQGVAVTLLQDAVMFHETAGLLNVSEHIVSIKPAVDAMLDNKG